MWLGCAMAACGLASAAQQQVIVDGAQRAGETVHVSGRRVPLLHALEQVVPVSYSINVPNAGPWADMPVSWQAGGSFVQVLGQLLAGDPSLHAHVNTDLHLVTVSAVPPVPAFAPEPTAAMASYATAMAASPAPAALLAPAVSLAPAESVLPVPPPSAMAHAAPAATAAARPAMPTMVVAQAMPADHPPAAIIAPRAVAVTAAATPAPMPAPALMPVAAPMPMLAPMPTPPSDAAPQVWEMRESDGSVRNTMQRWAREAGWQFIWDVPTDFTVDANATIHGSLEHALNAVVDALGTAQVPIQIVMYKGNRVLRVIPKGAA